MRKFFALSMAVIVIGASSACGPSQSNRGDESTEAERRQALRDSAFGSAAELMDRARGVEQLLQDRQRELEEAVEDSKGR